MLPGSSNGTGCGAGIGNVTRSSGTKALSNEFTSGFFSPEILLELSDMLCNMFLLNIIQN